MHGNNHVALTSRQLSILRGTMCGDGNLRKAGVRAKNVCLQLSQGPKQRDYLEWKHAELRVLFSDNARINDKRKNELHLSSRAFVELTEIYDELYFSGERQLTCLFLNKLDDLSMAVWFMDDGTVDNNRVIPVPRMTVRSAHDQHEIASAWFTSRGYPNVISKQRQGCRELYFKGESGYRFFDTVRPHIIESMRYKLGKKAPSWQDYVVFPSRKIAEDNQEEIIRLYNEGMYQRDIAKKFGVNQQYVSRFLQRC